MEIENKNNIKRFDRAARHPVEQAYHNSRWEIPVCTTTEGYSGCWYWEGMQAGLNGITVLDKTEDLKSGYPATIENNIWY